MAKNIIEKGSIYTISFLFFSMMSRIDSYSFFKNNIVLIPIASLSYILYQIVQGKLIIYKEYKYFIFLLISLLLSGFKVDDYTITLNGYSVIVMLLYADSARRNFTEETLSRTFLISGFSMYIIFILFPIIKGDIVLEYSRFRGVFHNSNHLGFMMATLYSQVLYYLFVNRIGRKNRFFLLIYAMSLLVFINFSGSRTAFLSVIVQTILYYIHLKRENKKTIINIKSSLIMISLISVLFILSYVSNVSLLGNIIEKNTQKMQDGFSLDGRFVIWTEIIRNVSILGNGKEIYHELIGSHSSYFHVLNLFGIVGFISFFQFYKIRFKMLKWNNNWYSIFNFLIISLTETIVFSYPFFIFSFFIQRPRNGQVRSKEAYLED